ncbi:unnamed protein product [Rangifer tarandus platyrhynchus]|uniref:Uncharacterized protein n=2 Tax=Rangifer tarandus platyrhynchus TaxID=3082113 RepID=A0ABN8YWC6_RANTA|nr:unnamed protein product [Rangifer tarandus platyrhynchus]CAI9701997.1 unnamed protein product [Rangifer tarandus platyrhynchus]
MSPPLVVPSLEPCPESEMSSGTGLSTCLTGLTSTSAHISSVGYKVDDELGHRLPVQHQGDAGGPEVAVHEGEVNHVPGEEQRTAACARAPLAGSCGTPTLCGRSLCKHFSQQAPQLVLSRKDPALAPAWTPPSIM